MANIPTNYTLTNDGWLVFDGIESDIHITDLDRTYPTPDPDHALVVMRKARITDMALIARMREAERDASQG